MVRRMLLQSMLLLSAASCAGNTIVVDGISVYESHWNQTVQRLGKRASFDLDCPRSGLAYTLFKRSGRYPIEVGVRGCGKRAVYIRPTDTRSVPGQPGGGITSESWILNSTADAS